MNQIMANKVNGLKKKKIIKIISKFKRKINKVMRMVKLIKVC